MAQDKLEEGIDYYYNADGRMVFTAHFLLKRGYCCGNGCLHCPYPKVQEKDNPQEKEKPSNNWLKRWMR